MDDRDREQFYSSENAEEDGDEYEVEAPDAEVVAAEERRAQEVVEATMASIDIDEIYREADHARSDEILQNWFRDLRTGFRFQVKHLLILTALLAIVLTLARLRLLGTAVVVLVMLSVAGLYLYLQWQDRKAQEAASRRRAEMYARRRAYMKKMAGGVAEDDDADVPAEPRKVPGPLPSEVDQTWQQAMAQEKFQFRFSMAELMLTMTTAAVILGLVHFMGGASNAATLLGFVALFGLIVHALGVEPPNIVVLGWWLILVLYVFLSLFAAVWSRFA